MKIGTRALLFGVHQVLWHPFTVWLAWRHIYGAAPSWRNTVAIFFHDWGYWGRPNIDGPEGKAHPILGARITLLLAGGDAALMALCHSRDMAAKIGLKPSLLCLADKYSIVFDPKWWYLLRGKLSGEVAEFKQHAIDTGWKDRGVSDSDWYDWYRDMVVAQTHWHRMEIFFTRRYLKLAGIEMKSI